MSRNSKDWKRIKQKSGTLRRGLSSLVEDIENLAAPIQTDAISACNVLERELCAWVEGASEARERCLALLRQLDPLRREQLETIEQRLSRELVERGHSVFGDSTVVIVDGIVHVEVDRSGCRVVINRIPVEGLDSTLIATKVTEEVTKLRRLVTQPALMLERLLQAYEVEIRASGVQFGSPVQSASLLFQLALLRQTAGFRSDPSSRSFREYPREVFRADLCTLLASGESTIQDRKFRHASGADTAGAIFMFVPALGRTAHVGRLWFETLGVTAT